MGHYTEFHFRFTLKKDCPEEIINIFDQCVNRMEELDDFYKEGGMRSVTDRPNLNIEHEFGKQTRWQNIFNSCKSFNKESRRFISNGDINHGYYEVIYFLDWIKPYIVKSRKKKGTYLGWSKAEDAEKQNHYYLEELQLWV